MRNYDRHRLADRLLGGKSEKPLCAAVPAEDHAIEILRQDGVVGRFDYGLIVLGCEIVVVLRRARSTPCALRTRSYRGWPTCFKTGFLAGARSPNLHRSVARVEAKSGFGQRALGLSYAVCPGLSTPSGWPRGSFLAIERLGAAKPGNAASQMLQDATRQECARRPRLERVEPPADSRAGSSAGSLSMGVRSGESPSIRVSAASQWRSAWPSGHPSSSQRK